MSFFGLPLLSLTFVTLALISALAPLVSVFSLSRLRKKRLAVPARWPSISILKPLAGHDDDLVSNLESHLKIDYPGEWELVLGVRSAQDPAYGPARDFAAAHPERARLVLQECAPGRNPKVNQLITLTRHAKGEYIALTDASMRVKPGYLREHAAALADEKTALSSHVFSGVGEQNLGAALDNMTVCAYVAGHLATGDAWGLSQIAGKSLCIKRAVLEEIGGWEIVKDLLAEDQRLGRRLQKAGYRTTMCPTLIDSVVRRQPVEAYLARFVRWQMIRFLVIPPAASLELLANPTPWAVLAVLAAPSHLAAWAFLLGTCAFSMAHTQLSGLLARGQAFPLGYMLAVPLRDLLMLRIWVQGLFTRQVSWRGNTLKVLWKTRLVSDQTLARLRRREASRRLAQHRVGVHHRNVGPSPHPQS